MYLRRTINVLRGSINNDRLVLKYIKRENSRATQKNSAVLHSSNQRLFAKHSRNGIGKLSPRGAIERKSIHHCAPDNVKHIINGDVVAEQNTDATINGTHDENTLACAPPVEFDVISNSLRSCSSVDEQLEKLYKIVKLEPEDVKARENICQSVKNVLLPFFKDCVVQMYGSSANGLGVKGCDIDMSFSIVGAKKAVIPPPYQEIDIPFVEEVISGKFPLEKLLELPPREQLIFIHTVLVDYYKEYRESVNFINVLPIIRFHHEKQNIQCDLTNANRVAYSNTKLLRFYGEFDERFTILSMAIRYWAKHIGLVGKGLVFNSYTITLLVTYFLQTRNPPVLPTVEHLLSLSDSLNNQDMKNCSYLEDIGKISPSENKQTTGELLKEFFWFYTYFDYTQVICPLTGTAIPRDDFFPLNPKFKKNTICVQDPMKLEHNVAMLVDYKHCKYFLTEVLKALKLFNDDTLLSPNCSKWGYLAIIDNPAFYSTALNIGDCQLSFEISKCLNVFGSGSKENEIGPILLEKEEQLWLQQASHTVLEVLEYALLFKCTIINSVNLWPNNRSKNSMEVKNGAEQLNQILIPGDNDCCTANKFKIPLIQAKLSEEFSSNIQDAFLTAECVAFNNTWLGRENLKRNNEASSINPLEVEHAISSELLCEEVREKKKVMIRFICECHASKKRKTTSLIVKLKPYQRSDFNPILGLFLRKYVPEVANRVLQTRNNDSPKQQCASNSC